MPMNTRLRRRKVPGFAARSSRATSTWPRISPWVRLRARPIWPVRQKVQAMAHPAWLDRHWVKWSFSGMSTVSISWPSASSRRNFTVPSALWRRLATRGTAMVVSWSRRWRRSLAMLVMARGECTRACHSHCQTCLAR